MAKHYLLTRKSKGLSIKDLARMSDEEAFDLFKQIRWRNNNGNPICPKCGNTGCWGTKNQSICSKNRKR